MLINPPLEKLLPKVDNRYTLAMLIAKRARQLVDGAQPMMKSDSPNNVTVACEELAAGRIACYYGLADPYIPLRPEVEAARMAARNAEEQASMADAVREALDQAAGLAGDEPLDRSDLQIITDQVINIVEEDDDIADASEDDD
ncbi:MAG: DNA-directed RNA polymerase subunit omega [Saccharofermentanales bacterium]|jgi:DNA-directed RNA polymerase omega subunit|nr:DNA-directed RNA polymerase subunit omega [Clostridiaceae bacterium]